MTEPTESTVQPNEKSENPELNSAAVDVKTPKKVLHFSDGTMEEFSDDDEIDGSGKGESASEIDVDESSMSWGPWLAYKTVKAGDSILYGIDYVGESISNFFGITSPKYGYEAEQYEKMQAERVKISEEDREAAVWSETKTLQTNVETPVVTEPTVSQK